MVYILDIKRNHLVEAEILLGTGSDMPFKKDGWKFNWHLLLREPNTKTFVLRIRTSTNNVEGVIQLKVVQEMLIMDVLEIAPHNVGKENKRYDYVAGCLIAFACRESFKIEGVYKGFLTFVLKTNLMGWYSKKYGAETAIGQRMFIAADRGLKLIIEYLERNKVEKL